MYYHYKKVLRFTLIDSHTIVISTILVEVDLIKNFSLKPIHGNPGVALQGRRKI